MNHWLCLSIGAGLALGLCAAVTARAGHSRKPSPQVVAVYTQADPEFTETVTLYADGKYRQTETERDPKFFARLLPHGGLGPFGLPPPADPLLLAGNQRDGTWRVLDRPGGAAVALKAGASLPAGATVELKGAMMFGRTWENLMPSATASDRSVPSASFQPSALVQQTGPAPVQPTVPPVPGFEGRRI